MLAIRHSALLSTNASSLNQYPSTKIRRIFCLTDKVYYYNLLTLYLYPGRNCDQTNNWKTSYLYYIARINQAEVSFVTVDKEEAIKSWSWFLKVKEGISPDTLTPLFQFVNGAEPNNLDLAEAKSKLDQELSFKIGDPLIFSGVIKEIKEFSRVDHLKITLQKGVHLFVAIEDDKVFQLEIVK